MSKQTVVTVGVPLNKRQHDLLKAMDPVYGDDVAERIRNIVVLFLHDNVPHLKGVGDED